MKHSYFHLATKHQRTPFGKPGRKLTRKALSKQRDSDYARSQVQ
ncbi:hypothetical protein [Vibrio agarivorans]|uniref:Integrase n=1 Tax=Vibrio agarivorans TaxID=153622 RepID=A0ABT7Y785_9VIBR|nr:hypothetical protein [Vibrio agarivorans]MDN2483922.1 hypothetical protein [Vibrio agarivorans]